MWDNYNEFNQAGLSGVFNIGVTKALPAENKVLFGTNAYGILEWDPAAKTISRRENQLRQPITTALPGRIPTFTAIPG